MKLKSRNRRKVRLWIPPNLHVKFQAPGSIWEGKDHQRKRFFRIEKPALFVLLIVVEESFFKNIVQLASLSVGSKINHFYSSTEPPPPPPPPSGND